MSETTKQLLVTRLKSLAWRVGDVLAVHGIDFVATNLELFNLPPWLVVVIGLLLGEVTKWLNSRKAS